MIYLFCLKQIIVFEPVEEDCILDSSHNHRHDEAEHLDEDIDTYCHDFYLTENKIWMYPFAVMAVIRIISPLTYVI